MKAQVTIDKLAQAVYKEWREKEGPLFSSEEVENIERAEDELFNQLSKDKELLLKVDNLADSYASIYEKHGFYAGFYIGIKVAKMLNEM